MLLPVELIDYTFSFLRGDTSALEACVKSDPLLSRLAERYLYADIVVGRDAEIYEHLSKNPHVLYYPRTLEIHANKMTFFQDYLPIFAMIPRMANLVSLKLWETPRWCFNRRFLSKLFEKYLHQSSVEQNLNNVKKLTLSDCLSTGNPTSFRSSHHLLPIETLVIGGYLSKPLLSQVTDLRLKSLQLPISRDWNAVSELVAAYSYSLTELHLYVDHCLSTSFYVSGLRCKSLFHPDFIGRGPWVHMNLDLTLTLSPHKFLKHLSIFAVIKHWKNMGMASLVYCPLLTITSLIKTAPAIEDVVLRLHWVDSHRSSLAIGQLDWSLLQYDSPHIRPRIHLFISGDTDGHPISSESILKVLTENETLMDLVKREVVILKAERVAPLGD